MIWISLAGAVLAAAGLAWALYHQWPYGRSGRLRTGARTVHRVATRCSRDDRRTSNH